MGQQIEQQFQQHVAQVVQAAAQQVASEQLSAGVATGYVDIVQPLVGQARHLFLRIDNQFKVFVNPIPQTHHEIQQAFAFGHQVIGVWSQQNPHILRSVRIQKI
ncbi:hypothetical protein NKH77_10850 [Streptomyces sp. M19]